MTDAANDQPTAAPQKGAAKAAVQQAGRKPANKDDAELEGAMAVEWDYVARRREASGVPPREATFGLALSGGGIRSATFSLGIMQALSRYRLIKQLDYLSTVSGGSYIGSFFGALYVDPKYREVKDKLDAQAVQEFIDRPLQSPRGRKAVSRLREFGRYLTPGGFSDTMYGMSLVARNWVALQIVLGLVPLLFFLTIAVVQDPNIWKLFDSRVMGPTPWSLSPALIQTVTWASQVALSWALLFLVILVVLMGAGLALGYWYSRREDVDQSLFKRVATSALFVPATVIVVYLAYRLYVRVGAHYTECTGLNLAKVEGPSEAAPVAPPCEVVGFVHEFPLTAITTVLAFSLLAYLWYASSAAKWARRTGAEIAPAEAEDYVRSRMTRALATFAFWAVLLASLLAIDLLAITLVDSVKGFSGSIDYIEGRVDEQNVYAAIRVAWRFFWPCLLVIAPALLTVWAHAALRRGTGPGWLARPSGQAAFGGSILFLWLVIWAACARAVPEGILPYVWAGVLVALVIELFCYGFLNVSSLVSLYAFRLKRAYVGASNPFDENQGFDIDRPGDHILMPEYYGPDEADPQADAGRPLLNHARPVHLINCTIAQTEPEGSSQVVAYDRKGKPLQVSPAGIVHQGAAAGWSLRRKFDDVEQLSVSTWTAISGAAASTAIGSLTSIGLSILAMMANVRLGYWWKAGPSTSLLPRSAGDTVLGYLISELQGRFATDETKKRRWYLTDGGHFENTGCYALIQRRLDFVIVCDNGADPDYRLDDLVRLIDRARTDLNAEIEFLDTTDLDDAIGKASPLRPVFGTYRELARPAIEGDNAAAPYAALARIRYDIDSEPDEKGAKGKDGKGAEGGVARSGTLLLIKPRLNFSEPPELLAYRRREAGRTFPQQTTLDQFFDEEQWEAYRRFGEVVGERIFATNQDGWSPRACLESALPLPARKP